MSDNRKRPIARRFKPETEALLQVYAKSRNITANEAAEQLLHGNAGVVVDAAAEIAALGNEVAWHKQREKDIVTACERVADGGQFRADIIGAIHRIKEERDAATRAADVLRADLESAREATRRADTEIEATRHANRILADRADVAEAEVARLTREVASFRGGLDLAAETIARLTADLTTAGEELEAERRRDEAAHDALRAEVERLATALQDESAAWREASGAESPTHLTAALETHRARRSSAAPCACALPDDLAARVKARIAARPGRDFAFVVKNGCDRLEGSDRYVDKKKAEREEANDA